MKFASVVVVLVLGGVGCSHTIQYKLTEKDRWQGPNSEKVVCVTTFQDAAPQFTNDTVKTETGDWVVNFRGVYEDKEIANGVSAMIATHLDQSGLFKKVAIGCTNNADYELTGTISEYSARGRMNYGAYYGTLASSLLGSFLGAGIALAATSGVHEPMQADVELRDVKLNDRRTGQTIWHDTINVSTNYNAYWLDADIGTTCQRADNCLRDAVNELIQRLAASGALGNSSSTGK